MSTGLIVKDCNILKHGTFNRWNDGLTAVWQLQTGKVGTDILLATNNLTRVHIQIVKMVTFTGIEHKKKLYLLNK